MIPRHLLIGVAAQCSWLVVAMGIYASADAATGKANWRLRQPARLPVAPPASGPTEAVTLYVADDDAGVLRAAIGADSSSRRTPAARRGAVARAAAHLPAAGRGRILWPPAADIRSHLPGRSGRGRHRSECCLRRPAPLRHSQRATHREFAGRDAGPATFRGYAGSTSWSKARHEIRSLAMPT